MTREIDFRFVVVRDGADYTMLLPADSGSRQLRMDDSSDIKTSFSGIFLDPGDSVNWLTDEIRPAGIGVVIDSDPEDFRRILFQHGRNRDPVVDHCGVERSAAGKVDDAFIGIRGLFFADLLGREFHVEQPVHLETIAYFMNDAFS